jgi:hypothetical protein
MFSHEGTKLIVRVVFKGQWHGHDLTGQTHLTSSTEKVEFDMLAARNKNQLIKKLLILTKVSTARGISLCSTLLGPFPPTHILVNRSAVFEA